MSVANPVAALVAPVIALTGTAIGVKSALDDAKAQAATTRAQGERDARTAEQQARFQERAAGVAGRDLAQEQLAIAQDVDTLTRAIRRTTGRQEAVVASSGFELTGSPLDVLVETAQEGALEIERARFASSLVQRDLRDEGELATFDAEELRRAGEDALQVSRTQARGITRRGRVRAAGTALQGVGQAALIASRRPPPPPSTRQPAQRAAVQ